MNSSQLRIRFLRIMVFFSKATLNFIFWELILSRIGFRRLARKNRSTRYQKVASQFRELAIRMGGVMIKVGQFLSSRLDVLPQEITSVLSGLQDEVPPENFDDIRHLAETDLEGTLEGRYEYFESAPLAAASLGQVHRARLFERDGKGGFRNVVVKIQRPNIDQLIEVDLSALRQFGGWLKRYPPISKRVDVPGLVEEFSTTIREEVDYLAEGKNAEIFAENFKDVTRVHVPHVVWSHTTRRVLTLEDVFAIKITDYAAISAAGIDRAEVAKELLDIYLKQIFDDGFFHADPHPGNLFITPGSPDENSNSTRWRLTFVDFGMVGHVPENLRQGLRDVLVSMGTRDAARLVKAYQTLGVLLPSADTKLIERASAQMFELFWGKSMSELRNINHADMFRFADQFRELMFDLPFQLPQNLLMLGRTVAILSGMCTGLHSEFNLWTQLAPYANKLISKEGDAGWEVWLDQAGDILKNLVALPSQVGRITSMLERGEVSIQFPAISRQTAILEYAIDRLSGALIFSALLLGAVILLTNGLPRGAYILFGCSLLVLFWMIFFRRSKTGRFHR